MKYREDSSEGGEIAVVGYAARLPGAENVEAFWDVLSSETCTVSEVPEDRWSSVRFLDPSGPSSGKSYTRSAGILDHVFDFDPDYFGIPRVEAEQMDPQQRLLLETTARAIEHAGVNPDALDKDRTGVFVGASASDHSTLSFGNPAAIGPHFMLGNTLSILSNRLSYQWDFRGPSFTVDTACSSSLFALDLARKSLIDQEIDTAIVGGVNLLLSPQSFVGFSQASMLSRRGKCQAFAAEADGYVRSEGAVVFLIQRSSVARAAGLRTRSFLVGTAVNNDGRTSGLAFPSLERQSSLIEDVIRDFGVCPDSLAFVEAHGTGTPVGDPQEAQALAASYARRRSERLPIGSAKSNFGHLEPAAGLVGLLKSSLSLENNFIPASLHAENLNPHIDFDALNLRLVRTGEALSPRNEEWCAAVNSFGFGGANAHAVLRQAPAAAEAPPNQIPDALLLTAATAESLRDLARDWCSDLSRNDNRSAHRVATANRRLQRHRHRLCVEAGSLDGLRGSLEKWLVEGDSPSTSRRIATNSATRVAFVFGGNGAAWAGMARHVFLNDAVFRESFRATASSFCDHGFEDVSKALFDEALDERLAQAEVAQPLTFAVQLAVAEALGAKGVMPSATLGHSVGEVAAAFVAGRISLEDSAAIIASRCDAFTPLFGAGTMAALSCSRSDAEALVAETGAEVDIAAENAPQSVSVSGEAEQIDRYLRAARRRRIPGRRLKIAYPYHSRAIDRVSASLVSGLHIEGDSWSDTSFYSGWMGAIADDVGLGTEYWLGNARRPVAFRGAVEAMANNGIGVFVEIGPSSVLRSYMRDTLAGTGKPHAILESLDRSRPKDRTISSIARNVIAVGGEVNETPQLGPTRPFVEPTVPYPFRRETLEMPRDTEIDLFSPGNAHPILGSRWISDRPVWRGGISLSRLPWLSDHKIGGRVLLPAMAIVDTLCCAVRNFLDVEVCELTDVEFLEPVVLPETGAIDTRVTLEVSTRSVLLEVAAAKVWQPVARATFQRAGASPITSLVLETNPVPDDFYSGLDAAGLSYGASFARLRGWRIHGGQVDVEIAPLDGCPAAQRRICESDAILHGVAAMISGAARAQVPRRIGRLRSSGEEGIRGASLVRLQAGERSTQVGVTAVSQDGRPILLMNDLVLRSLPSQASPELYWEEVMVPTGLMDRGPVLAPAIAGHKRTPGAAPTDRDIVRAALGGRLAWDLGMAEGAGSGTDLRRDVAQEWLLERGLARAADSGLAPLQDCPWPALDEMLRLVGESVRSSSDELFAALLAATEGERQRRRPLSRCRRVAAGLLGDAEGARSARILIAGDIDGELLALACERAGYATIVATDRTTRAEIRSMLAPGSAVRIVTLQDVGDTERFDIILGVSLLRSCSQTDINRFAGIARRSGEILLVDEMPDLFALMTYAYDDPGAMADALGPFISATSGFQQFSVASDECIVLHHGTGLERDAARTSVSGTETAERLSEELTTRLGVETSGGMRTVVLPAHATLSQRFEAIRSAADGVEGTTWIIDPVDADFEELTGWRRVACNETGADVRVLSAAPGISVDQIATTLSSTTEQEIRLAPDGSFAPRLVPVRLEDRKTTEPRYKLVADRAGASRGLRWESVPRRKPEAGEVEIEVSTIGLNFRDVMLAQGLLPDEAFEGGFAGRNLGIECSGIVARVPEGSSFAEGDRVAAFADGAFASHVTLPQANVIKLPDNVDLFDAATIPVAFLTADYAIRECARLQRGETVLIHGGAGAVGLAAIRIALSMGLRVFATAGTPEKRLFLKAQGVEGVFDSRSTDFADAILAATGSGVDSVVNSLSGEFLHRSLDCLAKFGRFVELGKRDIFANSHLGLRVLRNNISFFAVDADQLVADKPQVAGRILDRLSDELSDGRLTPLPFRAFPSNDIDAAFRLMQRAGHIGKIVVDAPKPPARSAPTTTLSIGGTWVVTGGSRGFGLETAKWLARQGAQVLWLVSRSGALDDDARTELETHGTKVKVIALDVTDRDRLTGLMDRIEKEGEGLTGVVHAAMVLEDGRLDDMDDAGVERVIAPKLGGARALDAATRRFEVEHFWLFSSVAARFGNPGQGPYVAGNRAIEALAASRGRDGLPALAVAWGPIADAGYLSRKAELRSVIDRQVGRLLSAKEALEAFQRFLEAGPGRSAITIAPMDWQKMRRSMPVLDGPLADLLDIGEPGATQEEVNLEELIAEVGLDRARERVIGMLRTEIAHLLRIPEDDIDPTRPLSEMGFDSLLAVQLKLAVEDRLHLEMPVNALGASVTLAHLVDVLFGERSGEQDRVAAIMAERHLVNADISEDLRAEIVSVSSGGRVQ